ncbi:hypothetical protein NDU88_005923 [Pleurodeles waltl]|uniref:Uncharacterized protein n=1 Tax=Pleurodeles waltl TaxID=8319 RepID=A0AAV7MG37_PLEWA|nr:hypothetical protein NDU88_005923 [Pleurodeles waltl]
MAVGRRRATRLWNLLPREGGGWRNKGHREPRSAAGPAGSVGPPQPDAPLTLVQGRALLQSKPGSTTRRSAPLPRGRTPSQAVQDTAASQRLSAGLLHATEHRISVRPYPRSAMLDAGGSHFPARAFIVASWEC